MQIGVMGATGPAGMGMAARLASVGHEVVAGSRDPARSEAAVSKLRAQWGERAGGLKPGSNADAAAAGDLVVLAVPWEGAADTARTHADTLDRKVVVAMANGLTKEGREFRAILPDEGSVSMAVQLAIPDARVVAAFQHIPAAEFGALDHPMDSDVIVCGDDDDARTTVLHLITGIPDLRGFDGGSLANALGIEAFAAVLLSINLRHRGKGSLRLLGVEGYPSSEPPA